MRHCCIRHILSSYCACINVNLNTSSYGKYIILIYAILKLVLLRRYYDSYYCNLDKNVRQYWSKNIIRYIVLEYILSLDMLSVNIIKPIKCNRLKCRLIHNVNLKVKAEEKFLAFNCGVELSTSNQNQISICSYGVQNYC